MKGAAARTWFVAHPETKKLLWDGHLWSSSDDMGTLGDMSKVAEIRRVMHMMGDFSPRQLDGLSEQLNEIMQYFRPYTPVDEDGIPETDENDRQIRKQSKYRDLPIKEIHQAYQELRAIEAYPEKKRNLT